MAQSVAFLGLGAMGQGMAARLQAHLKGGQLPGYADSLLVWNRTAAVAEAFAAQHGCRAAKSMAEVAAAKPSVVFSMLANDTAADAVLSDYLAACSGGSGEQALFVNCATVLPTTVTRQAAQAQAAGLLYANCPVFGRPDAAAGGTLVAVPAGAPAARERLAPLLQAFSGRGVWDLGDDPAASAALKLIGNSWIVSQIEVASQCLALGEANGIQSSHIVRMLDTFLKSPIPLGYAQRIAAGDYSTETGFGVDLALKDVGHMRTLAQQSCCPAPLVDQAFNHLLSAKARHGAELDWGAIYLAVRDAAGLPPNNKPAST